MFFLIYMTWSKWTRTSSLRLIYNESNPKMQLNLMITPRTSTSSSKKASSENYTCFLRGRAAGILRDIRINQRNQGNHCKAKFRAKESHRSRAATGWSRTVSWTCPMDTYKPIRAPSKVSCKHLTSTTSLETRGIAIPIYDNSRRIRVIKENYHNNKIGMLHKSTWISMESVASASCNWLISIVLQNL